MTRANGRMLTTMERWQGGPSLRALSDGDGRLGEPALPHPGHQPDLVIGDCAQADTESTTTHGEAA